MKNMNQRIKIRLLKSVAFIEACIIAGTFSLYKNEELSENINNYFSYKSITKQLDEIDVKISSEYDLKCLKAAMFPVTDNKDYCDYKFDGDYSKVVNNIKKNTEEFLKYKKEGYGISVFSEIEFFKDMHIDFEKFLLECLHQIANSSTNNIDEDFCHINDLRIVVADIDEDTILGNYTAYLNLISLDLEKIYLVYQQDTDNLHDFDEYLKEVLIHELGHTRQDKCNCKIIDFSVLDYFLFSHHILGEASNEDYSRYRKGTFSEDPILMYYLERKNQSLMFLLAMFNKTTQDDYYNAIYDKDVSRLYEIFELNNIEDKKNFYKSFYLSYRYIYTKFDTQQEKNDAENDFRIFVFKLVLKKLAKYTFENNDFSFEENLIMFELIKGQIIDKQEPLEECDNSNFIENIDVMQQKYYEFIKEYYDVKEESLELDNDLECVMYELQNEYIPISNKKVTDLKNSLNEKFPLLKEIFKYSTGLVSSDSYSNFVELCQEYQKKLVINDNKKIT